MNKLTLFARNIKHLPQYDKNDKCIFCDYDKEEHKIKMKEIKKKMKGKLCNHDCGRYEAHGELWCRNYSDLIEIYEI